VKTHILFLLPIFSFCFAEETGFSYWWQSDGLIDYQQMEELNDLSGDAELWCALAELYVGSELAEEADCVFAQEAVPKAKKGKKMWNANIKAGSNLDSNGNFVNKFAKASGKAWKFSGEAAVKEGKGARGTAGFRHGIFYAKGGDLTNKHKGVLSELNLSDLKLGGEWLFREGESDSSWIYGRYSKNFFGRSIYSGGNFRMVAPYEGGNRLWSRSWQGVRYGNWNLRVTEIAVLKERENALDVALLAERKRRGARLAFEHDKNKDRVSAGFKPVIKGPDSLWARAEKPLSMRIGWDKKMENVKISNSFNMKKNWNADKPLEYRSESKMKIPLAMQPVLTFRWTAHVYRNGRLNLRQFYVEYLFSL
jgi:hypothetical protein